MLMSHLLSTYCKQRRKSDESRRTRLREVPIADYIRLSSTADENSSFQWQDALRWRGTARKSYDEVPKE